jgi:ATP-dependent Clp protease ATP-binding subunit ClpE
MTSNAGSGDAVANVGFGATASGKNHSVIDNLSKYFKPEFLNRFDDIVEFNPLTKPDLLKIVSLMLTDVEKMLVPQEISLKVTTPAKEKLVELGYDPKMGARPLRRIIQEQIEDGIADYYLEHPENKSLLATTIDNKIKIQPVEKNPTSKKAN